MQKLLRVVITLNLGMLITLVLATGSPLPLLRRTWVSNAIADWWLLSTIAVVIMFLVLLTNRFRGKSRSTRFWLDVALFIAWLCAFVLILIVGIAGFGAG